MEIRSAIGLAAALFALAVACAPKARPTTADKGVAQNNETWVALEDFGTKIKVPNGWEFARKKSIVASFAKEARGAWVVAGTYTKADAKEKLALGLQELKIELGEVNDPQHEVVLNGISFARQDFTAARVDGKPARVVVLAADSLPSGKGIVVFIGYALSGDETIQGELRDAIQSLGPS
jgi:hypothetical protein